eukprot:TRINITY_DN7021_c0_g1_i1.p1 TRINITY_DN7021_c0_g1~~TRINITY_DN7021_c0_g1_i1.p1  ORF type:complete len:243 (-),score=53.32 TRINITY_DN7021_c0_g1_i1:141-869(-)
MGCTSSSTKNEPSSSEDEEEQPTQPVKPHNNTSSGHGIETTVLPEIHKIALIGAKGIGKSCFIYQLVNNKWEEQPAIRGLSIAVSGAEQKLVWVKESEKDNEAKWQNYALCNLSEYRVDDKNLQVDGMTVRSIRALVLAFGVDDRKSFEDLHSFKLDLIKEYVYYSTLPKYILGLKGDLEDEKRVVSAKEAKEWVEQKNGVEKEQNEKEKKFVEWVYLEASSKDNTNVDKFKDILISTVSEF